jgi:tetratricopeptide (TPR) repeat protein
MVGVVADPLGTTDSYYNLGSYHRVVDTPSAQAQLWFDRGMVWAYAFNHEEAVRCFEKALGLDPDLAIARWGIAYSVGPNYNKAWDAFAPVELAGVAASPLVTPPIPTYELGGGAAMRKYASTLVRAAAPPPIARAWLPTKARRHAVQHVLNRLPSGAGVLAKTVVRSRRAARLGRSYRPHRS